MVRSPLRLAAAIALTAAVFASNAYAGPLVCLPTEVPAWIVKPERRIADAVTEKLRVRGFREFSVKVTRLKAVPQLVENAGHSLFLPLEVQANAQGRVNLQSSAGIFRSDFLETCKAKGRYAIRIVFAGSTSGEAPCQRQVVEHVVEISQAGKIMESRN